ncbi:MAG: TRAP transporter substrate-binding protein [Hydrogenophaga sp.]|jgi:TRAP-type C4-dicarboxylate transport system substrate-binding protein|nr:TRAP transporter substrate-binding protein [Hydrogenophaga sp.]
MHTQKMGSLWPQIRQTARAIGVVMASAAALMLGSPVSAQEKTLVFATASPPRSAIATGPFEAWAKKINDEGAGVIKIDLRHGMALANPSNHYDRVRDGVVDITWGVLTQVGGQFPRLSFLELPFLTDDVSTNAALPFTMALWRSYEAGVFKDELKDIVPLFMTSFPQSTVHLKSKLGSVDDLAGRKIIAGGAVNSKVIQALGGVPLSINAASSYEAVQRGVADGRLMPWTAVRAFRFEELSEYHLEAPFGSGVGAVYMSRAAYEKLSDKAKEIINKHSGYQQSVALGKWIVEEAKTARQSISARPGVAVASPTPAQLAAWKKRTAQIESEWVSSTPDGAKVLSEFRAQLEKATKEAAN